MANPAELKVGARVQWRDHVGVVTSDYWRDRDRFSVRFDGEEHDLDFGAESLRVLPARAAAYQDWIDGKRGECSIGLFGERAA